VAHTFKDGCSRQYEEVITARSGEQNYVLTTTAPIRDSRGQITQVMEMSTNITQIRKLQDHLASLGLLIGSISHGVKGLLTGLDAGLYSLRSGLQKGDSERVRKGWEMVYLMQGRIRRTVLDILYYAKEREQSLEDVDVAAFSCQVAAGAQRHAAKNMIDFQFRPAPDLGTFRVDPDALNPALMNLLENAVDACLEDKKEARHGVVFSVSREDDVIVFDVEDNGTGMDEMTREKIFTLFFTSKGSTGTGLGLFIAHDTVSQLGGEIAVDSELGEGAHFHVRIPAKPLLTREDFNGGRVKGAGLTEGLGKNNAKPALF
jgi:signal transduction histidine kinase